MDLENRGAQVRGIQLNYSGPGEFIISPNAVLESNRTCNLIFNYNSPAAPTYPIRFSINCADLIGYSHTIEFKIDDDLEIEKLSHDL